MATRGNRLNLYILDPAIACDSKEVLSTAINQATFLSCSLPQTPSLILAADGTSFFANSDFWVFVAGIIPFAIATIEFWRRIAVGESFGTGSDSVVFIGEDNNPDSSRGTRVLGKGALIVAYILFAVSAAVLGVVLYSVVTSDAPPVDLASVATASIVDTSVVN